MEKNPVEVQHRLPADDADSPVSTVILPLGSLECHGPHLPYGTDAMTAFALALEVAKRVPGTAVLPVVPYGMSEAYREFPFTVSLRPGTMTAIVDDILDSLWREGVRRVCILNGHDGNIPSIEIAARAAKVAHPEMRIISLDAWWHTLGALLPPGFFEVQDGLGHGGEGELSMALALFPELCRPGESRGVVPELPPYVDVKWTFSELTDCGASGDPTKATPEKGAVIREAVVGALAGVLRSLDERGWDYRSPELRSEGPDDGQQTRR